MNWAPADRRLGAWRQLAVTPVQAQNVMSRKPAGDTDAVFRKVLRQPNFTWAEHGETLMRRRKPWYFEHEPRPGISVIGAGLSDLLRR